MKIQGVNGNTYYITPEKIIVDKKEYVFITNTEKTHQIDMIQAAKIVGADLKYTEEATSFELKPLTDHFAVYMLREQSEKGLFNTLVDVSTKISLKNKEMLCKKFGYDPKKLWAAETYLGCQNDPEWRKQHEHEKKTKNN